MKNKCIVKKAFFSKMFFENPLPLNNALNKCSLDLSLLNKWPVFLQNASGNPIPQAWKIHC